MHVITVQIFTVCRALDKMKMKHNFSFNLENLTILLPLLNN
jgi:hypothetical protein